MFSIWCGGQPGVDITARVAHRLLGLRGLPYPESEAMLGQAPKTALLKAKHHDNALLPLDGGFRHKMDKRRRCRGVLLCRRNANRRLKLLRKTVQREGGKAQWKSKSAWGGDLEVTADAARVMYDAGDELFRPAFAFVTGKLVNGMLYSTADTRALVELLAALKFDPATRAVIDGQEVALGETSIGQRSDGAQRQPHRARGRGNRDQSPGAARRFPVRSVKPTKTKLAVGERIQITVTPKEQTIAPLARLFLPGNLALLKGGANAQTATCPSSKTS